jgi:hypothetical protein
VIKKLLAALGTVALVAGLVALVAGPASAHNPNVSASCAAGLSVNLTDYNTGQPNANHVTVTIDGTIKTSQAFAGGFTQTYTWAAGASHTYEVVVTAYDDPTGSQGWSIDKTGKLDGCSTAVTVAAVTHTDAACTGAGVVGGGGYTVPTNGTGVKEYDISTGSNWAKINPGTYSASPGTAVTIRAIVLDGYTLTGTSQWSFTISSPYPSECVVPVPPTSSSSVCDGTPGGSSQASYSIPPVANGYYFTLANSTSALKPGTVKVTALPSTVTIVLVLQPGFLVPAGTQTSWTFAFASPGDCPMTVTPTAPTPQYTSCKAAPGQSTDNGYTIPTTVGVTYQVKNGASWTDLTPGFHNLGTGASSVEIRAVPLAHYTLSGITDWTFTFAAAKDCLVTVVPSASSAQAICDDDHPGQQTPGTYTLASVTGVIYSVKINNGSFAVTAAGTYPANPGDIVTVTATGDTANGYRVDGAPSWTFPFASAGACLVTVPVGDPVFLDGACDAAHPGTAPTVGTYEVLVATHVHYEAKVNSAGYVPIDAGTIYNAQPGDVVVIKVIADTGYVVTPAIANEKLTHTFATPGDCLVKADFVKPAATSQSCVVTGTDPGALTTDAVGGTSTSALSIRSLDGSAVAATLTAAVTPSVKSVVTHTLIQAFITIPATPHVQYFINDVLQTKAGDVTLPPGTYKVSAAAETGYFLQGYNGPWTEVLTSATPCGDLITHPLVFPLAAPVPMGCFSDGSFTLSNSINDAAALTWTVNGSVVSQGTFRVGTASTVVVHAVANGPAFGLEFGATTDWTFRFDRPTSCDLTTLALTGSTPTGWIIFGYAMLVSGLALVALRFARRRDEQA